MGSLFYLWGIETWVLQFSSGYDTIVKEGGYMEYPNGVISFSGGKDSTAMLLMMIEREVPFDKIILVDTTIQSCRLKMACHVLI